MSVCSVGKGRFIIVKRLENEMSRLSAQISRRVKRNVASIHFTLASLTENLEMNMTRDDVVPYGRGQFPVEFHSIDFLFKIRLIFFFKFVLNGIVNS